MTDNNEQIHIIKENPVWRDALGTFVLIALKNIHDGEIIGNFDILHIFAPDETKVKKIYFRELNACDETILKQLVNVAKTVERIKP